MAKTCNITFVLLQLCIMKYKLKSFFVFILLLFNGLAVSGQQEYTWQVLQTPSFADFKSIRFVNQNTGLSGRQAIVFDDSRYRNAFYPPTALSNRINVCRILKMYLCE